MLGVSVNKTWWRSPENLWAFHVPAHWGPNGSQIPNAYARKLDFLPESEKELEARDLIKKKGHYVAAVKDDLPILLVNRKHVSGHYANRTQLNWNSNNNLKGAPGFFFRRRLGSRAFKCCPFSYGKGVFLHLLVFSHYFGRDFAFSITSPCKKHQAPAFWADTKLLEWTIRRCFHFTFHTCLGEKNGREWEILK